MAAAALAALARARNTLPLSLLHCEHELLHCDPRAIVPLVYAIRHACVRAQHVRCGEAVIREGTYGNDFYVIEEGEVACTQHARPDAEVSRRLTASDFFGERALLSTERRAATVTATRATTLLVLDRDTFLRLLGPLEDIIRREAQQQQRLHP